MIFECFPAIALKWLNAGMNARVSNQSTELRKRFRANVTLIRFLASMKAHVLSQIALLRKRLSTNFAFERPLACMRAKMKCQIAGTQTRFIARSTHVWSERHVRSRVNSQIAFITKRFITNFAFERLLASMYKIVSFQISSTRKISIADFTDMSSSS